MAKTVLVTGAAGFIGSHTSDRLLSRGDHVLGLDSFDDYYDPARKRANVEEIRSAGHPGRFELIEGDVRDRDLLAGLFDAHAIDAVVHLAALPGVRASIGHTHRWFDVNFNGTVNLLDLVRDHGTDNFVFASTSSVYGRTERIPFDESDACDRPLAPYPASKRAGEIIGHTYHHLHGVNFTALRFFTVYGPRNRPDMMAGLVVDSIVSGKTVPLYNQGQMYRDWTYVGDIVEGVVAAVDKPLGYAIMNLGRGEPVLLADFVRTLEELVGGKATFKQEPMPDADMERTYARTDRIREALGYQPSVSVQEGTRRYWEWYQRAVLGR